MIARVTAATAGTVSSVISASSGPRSTSIMATHASGIDVTSWLIVIDSDPLEAVDYRPGSAALTAQRPVEVVDSGSRVHGSASVRNLTIVFAR